MLPYHSQGLPYFFTCEHLWLLAKLRLNATNLVAQRPLDPSTLTKVTLFFYSSSRLCGWGIQLWCTFCRKWQQNPKWAWTVDSRKFPQILACFSGDELRKWAEKWPVSRGARRKREGSRRSGRSLSTYFVPSILSSVLPDKPTKPWPLLPLSRQWPQGV